MSAPGGHSLPESFRPVDDPESVPIRDAATVALIRDAAVDEPGIEVFLIRRVTTMAFAGGMTVFPGGGVDPRDAEDGPRPDDWVGPGPHWWAEQFDAASTPDDAAVVLASSLVRAAVRETFEECGVLLAGQSERDVVADAGSHHDARRALESKEQSLSAFLDEAGLVLRADLLAPLARWITPLGERRRYDTRFFLAQLPAGQTADDRTSEAASAGWCRVADIMASWRSGEVFLLPPTWSQLEYLAGFATVADAMAAPREIVPVTPTLISDGSALRIEFDGSARYTGS
ncbi:NUDIX hydrolase [Williamsia sp. SKLECPSW1]